MVKNIDDKVPYGGMKGRSVDVLEALDDAAKVLRKHASVFHRSPRTLFRNPSPAEEAFGTVRAMQVVFEAIRNEAPELLTVDQIDLITNRKEWKMEALTGAEREAAFKAMETVRGFEQKYFAALDFLREEQLSSKDDAAVVLGQVAPLVPNEPTSHTRQAKEPANPYGRMAKIFQAIGDKGISSLNRADATWMCGPMTEELSKAGAPPELRLSAQRFLDKYSFLTTAMVSQRFVHLHLERAIDMSMTGLG